MTEIDGVFDAGDMRVAIAVADFNEAVTGGLLAGAVEALAAAGAAEPTIVHVPGAFELPVVVARLAEAGYEAIVALGAVIEGETDHYEHVATQCAAGLRDVALTWGVPVGFGVLTVRNADHAIERSRPGPGNKGAEAAGAAVRTARALRNLGRTS
ncbi:MAG TPA: 6,7-dimethyl-8-ribityllumazine synthase [Acidimicrobiia bacterium]|nr:6,7-dimethyl-8-ribityllumazine synthase [Acidimicrobiia bacterium]